MQKNTTFKILNPILAVFTVSQGLSATFRDDLSLEVFQWVHKGGGTLLLVGIGLHVVLNWSWVRTNVLPHHRR